MGSVEEHPDEFTVLVTGFAVRPCVPMHSPRDHFCKMPADKQPFKTEYPQNPSWEIASRLPDYLPARTKTQHDVAATGAATAAPATAQQTAKAAAAPDLPPVRIVVYPEPVRVNYQTVRKLVPTLWDVQAPEEEELANTGNPQGSLPDDHPPFAAPAKIDLVLHIGMAGPRLHYALERVGRRDGYTMRDVDGQFLGDSAADRADPAWPWYGVPAALETHIDLDDVLSRWRRYASPGLDLRISVDAGRYLCDFMYFSSLAHLFRRNQAAGGQDARFRRRRVVFLHVPSAATPERIEVGRALAVELIRALVEAELVAGTKGGADGTAAGGQQEEAPSAAASMPASGADTVTGKWYRD